MPPARTVLSSGPLVYLNGRREAVTGLRRLRRNPAPHERSFSLQYSASGHPYVEAHVAEQGTGRRGRLSDGIFVVIPKAPPYLGRRDAQILKLAR